jgi:hypothetical protein
MYHDICMYYYGTYNKDMCIDKWPQCGGVNGEYDTCNICYFDTVFT